MATVRTEFEIAADAADIWSVIRRFDTGPLGMAPGFVTACIADGDHRLVTFADGTVVRERLVSVDEERMRIAYSVVGDDLVPDHDNAVMRVFPSARDAAASSGCAMCCPPSWANSIWPPCGQRAPTSRAPSKATTRHCRAECSRAPAALPRWTA